MAIQHHSSEAVSTYRNMHQLAEDYLQPNSLVADFGAGHGYNSIFLAEAGHTVAAVEPDQEARSYTWQQAQNLGKFAARLNVIEGDVRRPIFDDESFDAVFVNIVLQHVGTRAAALRALRDMQAITTPGGHNFITAYTGTPEEQAQKPSFAMLRPNELSQLYTEQGWEIRHLHQVERPLGEREGRLYVSSYDEIVAQKPKAQTTAVPDRYTQGMPAEYWRRADPEYYDHLVAIGAFAARLTEESINS